MLTILVIRCILVRPRPLHQYRLGELLPQLAMIEVPVFMAESYLVGESSMHTLLVTGQVAQDKGA